MATSQTTDAIQPPFISMIYVKSEVVKLKPANEQIVVYSLSTGAYQSGQLRSQWGIWHANPHSPRLQQGTVIPHRSPLITKIHKEAQSPNIVIKIIIIRKTNHQTYLGILKKTLYFKSILITLIFCLYIWTSSIHWSWTMFKTLIN